MKKIFNFQQFIKESYGSNCPACDCEPCVCEHNEMQDMHTSHEEPETIDVEHEELEFCPQCGEDWEYCVCGGHHDMTHVPSHEMELMAHEDYSFLDEEETNEKKKSKEGKTPTTKKEKDLAAKYPPKDKITRGDFIAAAKENSGKKDKDDKEDDKEDKKGAKGLTAGQKKLPKALQDKILSKQK